MLLVELFEGQQKSAVMMFGRLNPPTVGHQKLMQKVMDTAAQNNADVFIVPSKTQDNKKNPLSFEDKKYFIEQIYGYPVHDDPNMKSPFQMAGWLGKNGYKDVTFIVGSDRIEAFSGITEHYFKDYGGEFKVVSAGERDPDADGVEGMSASKMRDFAKDGDLESFMQNLPPETKIGIAKKLMDAVRGNLKEGAQVNLRYLLEHIDIKETGLEVPDCFYFMHPNANRKEFDSQTTSNFRNAVLKVNNRQIREELMQDLAETFNNPDLEDIINEYEDSFVSGADYIGPITALILRKNTQNHMNKNGQIIQNKFFEYNIKDLGSTSIHGLDLLRHSRIDVQDAGTLYFKDKTEISGFLILVHNRIGLETRKNPILTSENLWDYEI